MPRNLDLFDFLSDSLLCMILSYLPFIEAARTCILSKRWRNLWHSSKNIEFHERSFIRPHVHSGDGKLMQKHAFINYVCKFIYRYQEPKVDSFRLSFSCPHEFYFIIKEWINVVVNLNVEEVDLSFYKLGLEGILSPDHKATLEIPSCLYEHGALQSLSLAACNLNSSRIKNFSSLKKLSVECTRLSESFLKNLLPNCSSLESLSLKKCLGLDDVILNEGTGTKLTELSICDCRPHRIMIDISIPSLRFFKYSGSMRYFILQGLISIDAADLDFGFADVYSDRFRDIVHRILQGLRLAERLTVCSYVIQVLPERGFVFIPPIAHLEVRHLIIKVGLQATELPGIMTLLMYCPMLDTLSIEMGFGRQLKVRTITRRVKNYGSFYKFNFEAFRRRYKVQFNCLKEKLKVIEVDGYRGYEYEEELLRFLLKEANVLERITLTTSKEMDLNKHPDTYLQNAQRIQGFKRASHNLLVSIQ